MKEYICSMLHRTLKFQVSERSELELMSLCLGNRVSYTAPCTSEFSRASDDMISDGHTQHKMFNEWHIFVKYTRYFTYNILLKGNYLLH